MASDQVLSDKKRYPTITTFPAGDHSSVQLAAKAFLEKFKWTTLTFFCDAEGSGAYYMLSCLNIQRKLLHKTGEYLINLNNFNSQNMTDMKKMLIAMKTQSRGKIAFFTTQLHEDRFWISVALLFCRPWVFRNIMVKPFTYSLL